MQEKRKMRPKRSMEGEIVEVEGGRIIRALARKDRHSKVCTAKGPKDRRVRLSAKTAIQFYDVQDRLGYDRPSLAIDWLMNEAKHTIDALNNHHLLPAKKSSPSTIGVSQYYNVQNQQLNVSELQTSSFTSFFKIYPESLDSRSKSLFSINSTHQDFERAEEMVHLQRMVTWNLNPSSSNGKELEKEFDINSFLAGRLGDFSDQNQHHNLFTQREPLQSSYLSSTQASIPAPDTSFGIGFANDGFLGFSYPTRNQVQEEQEQENLVPKQLSSATSLLHFHD